MDMARKTDGRIEVYKTNLTGEGGRARVGRGIESCVAVGGKFVHINWEAEICEDVLRNAAGLVGDARSIREGEAVVVLFEAGMSRWLVSRHFGD